MFYDSRQTHYVSFVDIKQQQHLDFLTTQKNSSPKSNLLKSHSINSCVSIFMLKQFNRKTVCFRRFFIGTTSTILHFVGPSLSHRWFMVLIFYAQMSTTSLGELNAQITQQTSSQCLTKKNWWKWQEKDVFLNWRHSETKLSLSLL